MAIRAAEAGHLDQLKLCAAHPDYDVNYYELDDDDRDNSLQPVLWTAVLATVPDDDDDGPPVTGVDAIAFLLTLPGIDINCLVADGGCYDGQTAFYQALKNECFDIANLLLARPDLEPCVFGGDWRPGCLTVLDFASICRKQGNSECPSVQTIMAHPGFNPNACELGDYYTKTKKTYGLTMLTTAVFAADAETGDATVAALLACPGIDIHAKVQPCGLSPRPVTALECACWLRDSATEDAIYGGTGLNWVDLTYDRTNIIRMLVRKLWRELWLKWTVTQYWVKYTGERIGAVGAPFGDAAVAHYDAEMGDGAP